MTLKEAIEKACIIGNFKKNDYDRSVFTAFADLAQKIIASLGTKIIGIYTISKSTKGTTAFDLPDDFIQLARIKRHCSSQSVNYEQVGNKLYINDTGDFDVFYYRMPCDITENTSDDYTFEVYKSSHFTIPYYIAYQILKTDDADTAQTALTEWNKYIALLETNIKTITKDIINYY